MSNRNRTPRTAALLLSIAVGGASLTLVPAAEAVTKPSSSQVKAVVVADTVVARLSISKGAAGETVLVQGTKLATADADGVWTAKAVKFGTTTVPASDVTALSGTALLVKAPAAASGAVTVLVGDATKGPKFTYVASVTTGQDDLDALTVTSDNGLTGATIVGDHLTKATKIVVGGKTAAVAKDGVAADGKKITFAYPAGLVGEQDVVVVDSGEVFYLGYVKYTAIKPTISSVDVDSALAEAPTTVTLTGSNLNLVTGVTYNKEKASFVKPTTGTKLVVTVPKGAAVTDGALVVSTKYASASTKLDRVAAKEPTVTDVAGAKAAGGEVTLTGTNLVGLKSVKVYSTTATVKTYAGTKITVVNATTAKVTLPALPDKATYKIEVTTWFAKPSVKFDFNVGTVVAPTPAPTLTAVSFDAADVDAGTPDMLTLTGTNLAVGQKVRYYSTTPGDGATVAISGAGSATDASAALAGPLDAGDYHAQISKDGGTTWETAVVDFTVA